MLRFVIFLISYGCTVVAFSHCILYLNYRTLGYSWKVVLTFITQTTEFYIGIVSFAVLLSAMYALDPLRSPSS